jgi:hypothetical protein
MDEQVKTQNGLPISFTKQEYRLLVRCVFQQLFMLESMVEEHASKEFEHLNILSSKLLKFAPDFSCSDVVATDVVDDTIHANSTFLDSIMQAISEYDDVSFWEELTHRMSERDLMNDLDSKRLAEISEEEYLQLLTEKLIFYTNHFSNMGLENVKISN